ncbi:hypothetical protein B0T10DRAFT_578283 [Thelonectria olida]|uniref:Uncharacterized protein n=1 Tax=Thelonectria olida TaxID=1576542 RepID=A0A9P8WJH9_9HYPO|nr:hypothetical protein B0T10DRAFT_578283 [Thelonectria olida]
MPKTPKSRQQYGDVGERELRSRGKPYPPQGDAPHSTHEPKPSLQDKQIPFDSSQVLRGHETISSSQDSVDALIHDEGGSNGTPASNSTTEQTSHMGDILRHLGTRADRERQTTNEMMTAGLSWVSSRLDGFSEQLQTYFSSTSNPPLLLKQLDEAIQQKEAAEKTIVLLKQQKELAGKANAQLAKQNEAAGKTIAQLQRQKEAMEQALEKSNERLEKARTERDAQRRIAEGGTLANSTKVTDDAIKSQWAQLRYNIRNLARYLGSMQYLQLTPPLKARFRTVSTEWKSNLDKEATKELMWEAYLWTMVRHQIISTEGGEWAGNKTNFLKLAQTKILGISIISWAFLDCANLSAALWNQPEKQKKPESDSTEPSLQDIARWCSQGSNLLNHVVPFDQQAFEGLLSREATEIRSCFGRTEAGAYRMPGDAWDEMRMILGCALDLDRMLTDSKALFTIFWSSDFPRHEGKLLYSDGYMEAVAHNPPLSNQSSVEFFTSPVLLKRGNADGQNYNQEVVLIKACVVCS